MAGKNAAISIYINGDASGARKGFKDAEVAASGFEGKMASLSSRADSFGDKMQATGKNLSLKVSLPLAAAGAAAFKLAADTKDAMGASEQIYGSASGAVKAWADKLPSYYGIAKGEAYEYTNIMGSLMKNLGGMSEEEASKQATMLTELAGDLAAMYGGSTEQAVNAMTSALKGNTEMLDNYGISATAASLKAKAMELGISDGTSVLTDQQKQAAMLAIILEQTGDAQGQAAREADGASGKWRTFTTDLKDMTAELGEKLLPAGSQLLGWGSDAIAMFGALPAPVQTGAIAFGALAAAAGPAMYVIGSGAKMVSGAADLVGAGVAQWRYYSDALSQVAATQGVSKLAALRGITAASLTPTSALGYATAGLGVALGGIAVAGAAGQVINELGDYANKAKRELVDVREALLDGDNQAALESFGSAVSNLQAEFHLSDLWKETGREMSIAGLQIRADIENIDRAFDQVLAEGGPEAAARLVDAMEANLAVLDPADQMYKDTADAVERYRAKLGDANQATDVAKREQEDMATATDEVASSVEEYSTKLQAMTDQLREMSGASRSVDEAQRALADANAALVTSISENGATFDEATDAGRRNKDALVQSIDASIALATAQASVDQSGATSTATLLEQAGALKDLADKGLITNDQFLVLLSTYGLTPDAINTRVTADTRDAKSKADTLREQLRSLPGVPAPEVARINALIDQGSVWAAEGAISNLTRYRTVNIGAMLTFLQGPAAWLAQGNQRAKGGPVSAGTPYLVGEEGPELIVPDANGMVLTASETAALARGGSRTGMAGGTQLPPVVVNFNGPVTRDDAAWVTGIIQDAVRRGILRPGDLVAA